MKTMRTSIHQIALASMAVFLSAASAQALGQTQPFRCPRTGGDLIFALDSIPAIFAITTDPFIVYTSNVFAILGLRALYFALAGVLDKFHLLKYSLSLILVLIGIKMVMNGIYGGHFIKTEWALLVTAGLLVGAVIGSLIWPKTEAAGDQIGHDAGSA